MVSKKIFQAKAKLLYNKKVNQNYLHCALESAKIASTAMPGQFVNIKVTDSVSPLLRRPVSIHRINGKKIELLYAVVGQATKILSEKKPGEYLDLIGPLGNGFTLQSSVFSLQSVLLVAGGMGVAPLVFLAEILQRVKGHPSTWFDFAHHKSLGTRGSRVKGKVLIGAKTKSQIICEDEFRKLGYEVKIATDDGSRGFKGKVTDLLKKFLPSAFSLEPSAIIYACGPRPMLKEIAFLSCYYRIPAQVSLEEHMSCGIGACLGCAVNTKQGYKRVCKEGPVFEADEVVW